MSSDSTGVLAGQAPARGSRRWHWIVGFGAVIVALGCVGFAVYWWTRPAPPPPTPPISKPDPKKFGTEEGAKEFADQCAYNKEKEASPFTGHRRGGGFMEKELRDALHFSVEQANFDPVTGYWTVTGILAFDGPVTAITLPDGRNVSHPAYAPWEEKWKVVAEWRPSDQRWHQISGEASDRHPPAPKK